MKKRILLTLAALVVFAFALALFAGAAEIDYSERVTLSDGTTLPLYDENNESLIWFVIGQDESGSNIYASVAVNNNAADNATSYVTYNVNSTYGKNQMHDIYIKYWNAETSAYVNYNEGAIVIMNLRSLTKEYWCIGSGWSSDKLEYVYHSSTVRDVGDFTGFKKLQLVDFYYATNYTGFAEQPFDGCSALREVRFGTSEEGYAIKSSRNGCMFRNCTSLTTLVFADISKITEIEGGSFYGCSALTGTYEFTGVKTIGATAFRYAATNEDTNLILKFPVIESIGGSTTDCYTFGNSGIKEIYLGGTLSSMNLRTFDSSTRLEKVVMDGTSMTYLPMLTFNGCTGLKAFSVPEGIKEINSYVFAGCTSLTAVYLPSTLEKINSGSQGASTFYNCKKMYFVNEPFTFTSADDIPTAPDIYYFPSSLVLIKEETFKVCESLNKTLVFPEGITDAANSWIFEAATGNVTLENIVFLGDMVNVSSSGGSGEYWDFKGNIYFANPNDKSLSDVNMGAFKARAVFCFAEDNTSHLAEQTGKTSAPDCENAGMTYDICFCGQAFNKVEDVTAPALGHIYEQNKIVAITYADIAKNGTYTTNCDRCEHNEVAVKADSALFIYNGISTNGTGELCVGYVINVEAIGLYKQFNPDVTLDFGIVAAATDYIGENEAPLDKDGEVVSANVIKTELTGNTARAVDFKLKGDFSLAENAKLNLTMGMYVILNGKVSYIYNSATDTGNEASCNAGVKVVTYELIASLAK